MGYCMNQREASFKIKKENVEPCLKSLKKLAAQAGKKGSGGTYANILINRANGKHTLNFSWVDTERFAEVKTLKDAIGEWQWDIEMQKDGSVDGIYFSGDKSGDDIQLFEAIAPYVESGSYIEMSGEDGTIWRWKFEEGKCTENEATLDWEDNIDIVDALLKEKKILPTLLGIHPSLDRRIGKVFKGGVKCRRK